jgi:hypothetical protein
MKHDMKIQIAVGSRNALLSAVFIFIQSCLVKVYNRCKFTANNKEL